MKFIRHTLNTILLFGTLSICSSCTSQNNNQAAIGKSVQEIDSCIWSVFQDKDNNYWFGSNGKGVYRYDGQKTIVHFTTADGLCNNTIWKIEGDQAGNIYFTTSEGCISKFDGKSFTTLSITPNSVGEWKLEPDDLWFKGPQNSAAVYRYDGKTLYLLELPRTELGDKFVSEHSARYPNLQHSIYDVYTSYRDSKGNIWFGTAAMGACRYDGKSFTWVSDEDVNELHDGPSNGVRSFVEDQSGYFWFSNTISRYEIYGNEQNKGGTNYRKEKGIGSLDGRKEGVLIDYLSIAKDNNGVLWIVTYADGVWLYDETTNNISHYPVKKGNKNIKLFSIYKDKQGVLWLGTHEDGVYKFNGKTFEKFKL